MFSSCITDVYTANNELILLNYYFLSKMMLKSDNAEIHVISVCNGFPKIFENRVNNRSTKQLNAIYAYMLHKSHS